MWKDPFEEMRRFRKEMNNLFDTFWGLPKTSKNSLLDIKKNIQLFREPLSDLKETDKRLVANIEMPGIDKKDIQLLITENNLEVKVEKRQEEKIKKKGYIKSERSYKGFYRSINLPVKIVPEQVKASYKNGILEVVMPKAERKKLKKAKIQVD